MLIKKQHEIYRGFSTDEIADFNGLPVKMIRTVATPNGQSWRVEALDGSEERFTVELSLFKLLVKADASI